VRGFCGLRKFNAMLWRLRVWVCLIGDVSVENLDLDMLICRQAHAPKGPYEVVSILYITTNSHLTSTFARPKALGNCCLWVRKDIHR